jgi:hypothetical protein
MVAMMTMVAKTTVNATAMEVSGRETEATEMMMETMEAASKATIVNTMVAAMVVTMMTTTKLAGLRHRAVCTTVMEAN